MNIYIFIFYTIVTAIIVLMSKRFAFLLIKKKHKQTKMKNLKFVEIIRSNDDSSYK